MSSAKLDLLKAICELETCGELDGLLSAAQRAGLEYKFAYQLLEELRADKAVTAYNNGNGIPINITPTFYGRSLVPGEDIADMTESQLLDVLRYRINDQYGKKVLREVNARLKRLRVQKLFNLEMTSD